MKLYNWKNALRTIGEIADIEGVKYTTLCKKLVLYQNIYHAVESAKAGRRSDEPAREETACSESSTQVNVEEEYAKRLFEQIMGMRRYVQMNFRKGPGKGEWLWDGDLLQYRLLMGSVRSIFTATFVNSGIQLCRREFYI